MEISKVLFEIQTASLVLPGNNLALCNELQHQCLLNSHNHVITDTQWDECVANVYNVITDADTEQKLIDICSDIHASLNLS